jgi:hypothetical protein
MKRQVGRAIALGGAALVTSAGVAAATGTHFSGPAKKPAAMRLCLNLKKGTLRQLAAKRLSCNKGERLVVLAGSRTPRPRRGCRGRRVRPDRQGPREPRARMETTDRTAQTVRPAPRGRRVRQGLREPRAQTVHRVQPARRAPRARRGPRAFRASSASRRSRPAPMTAPRRV